LTLRADIGQRCMCAMIINMGFLPKFDRKNLDED